MEIQNEGLGEHRLRDLNDEINKLLKEKWQWEMRIKELGGPNYIIRGGGIEEGGVSVKPKGAREVGRRGETLQVFRRGEKFARGEGTIRKEGRGRRGRESEEEKTDKDGNVEEGRREVFWV